MLSTKNEQAPEGGRVGEGESEREGKEKEEKEEAVTDT